MVFITDIGFIFMSKFLMIDKYTNFIMFTIVFFISVQKNSYASILFVLSMNQFFLSFLVPVVIELSSESK